MAGRNSLAGNVLESVCVCVPVRTCFCQQQRNSMFLLGSLNKSYACVKCCYKELLDECVRACLFVC